MALRRKPRRKREHLNADVMRKGVFFLPSLVTTASLFFGFYSVIHSFNGHYREAAVAILIAAIFDFFDGFVARITNTATEFGLQYDSLSDLMSFGLAPAILAYTWALQPFGRIGWLAAFLFFACAALRLARYNVQAHHIEKSFFQGLPTPAAAGFVASWVLFQHYISTAYLFEPEMKSFSVVPVVFFLAFFMVSTFRYRNFKHLNLRDRHPFQYLVIAVLFLILVASEPEMMLFPIAVIYVAHAPFETLVFFQRRRAEKAAARTTQPNLNEMPHEPPV